jgi:hypothetical protein
MEFGVKGQFHYKKTDTKTNTNRFLAAPYHNDNNNKALFFRRKISLISRAYISPNSL